MHQQTSPAQTSSHKSSAPGFRTSLFGKTAHSASLALHPNQNAEASSRSPAMEPATWDCGIDSGWNIETIAVFGTSSVPHLIMTDVNVRIWNVKCLYNSYVIVMANDKKCHVCKTSYRKKHVTVNVVKEQFWYTFLLCLLKTSLTSMGDSSKTRWKTIAKSLVWLGAQNALIPKPKKLDLHCNRLTSCPCWVMGLSGSLQGLMILAQVQAISVEGHQPEVQVGSLFILASCQTLDRRWMWRG